MSAKLEGEIKMDLAGLGYSDKPKLQPLVGEISWAKNLLIMAIDDQGEYVVYLKLEGKNHV